MVSAPVSTYLYSHGGGPQVLVWILALAPLPLLPLIYLLDEERHLPLPSTQQQCLEIWRTVCNRSVWQPMGFIYLFNLLQVKNAAWRQFLQTVLGFSASQLNTLLVASYVLLFAGMMVYKYTLMNKSWRWVYRMAILLNGLFSLLQLLLIQAGSHRPDSLSPSASFSVFGLSPFWFALGDDALAEFLVGIQFLPVTILMVSLCPTGSEGASYAMLTTVWNSAMMVAPALSTMLLGIWPVGLTSLQAGDLHGLFYLSLLTTALQMVPLVFLSWLPHGRAELEALAETEPSRWGGAIFLIILFGSMLYTLVVSLLNIVFPGWSGGV